MTVTERLLHYVSFDTQSDESSETCPSTAKQKLLGEALVEEMRALGIADARIDADGYVYGSVPGTPGAPAIGLIAHMDTSPDCSGRDIKPRIVEYTGGDIALNDTTALSPEDFPILNRSVGKHLIVTDGTTLLGADDKAGIAEILTAVEELLAEGGAHASLRIGFTPDEEIGRGADRFDLAHFGADYAYTVDGGTLGELEYENFNAAKAVIHVTGRSVHPGDAKDKMKNAAVMAMEFHSELPKQACPERTSGYEGFFHLTDMHGSVEAAQLSYIIRDHDREKFEKKKQLVESICSKLNERHGGAFFAAEITDQYYNMKEKIEPYLFLIENVKTCMKKLDIEPHIQPIRGGTDGARLSFMGIPCPNLCAGGHNFHGRYEYCCVESMEKITQLLILLAQK